MYCLPEMHGNKGQDINLVLLKIFFTGGMNTISDFLQSNKDVLYETWERQPQFHEAVLYFATDTHAKELSHMPLSAVEKKANLPNLSE